MNNVPAASFSTQIIEPDFSYVVEKPFIATEIPLFNENQFHAFSDANISACGTLDASGIYTLNASVQSDDTCFIITAEDVILDCQGNQINFSASDTGYGIYSDEDSTTIKNCVIVEGAGGSVGSGIYFSGASNGTIDNNTIFMSGSNSNAVHLTSASDSVNISDNQINVLGGVGEGIFIDSSDYVNITNNSFVIEGSNSYGISFNSSSHAYVEKNNISTTANQDYGFYLFQTANSDIINNEIVTLGDYAHGIVLYLYSIENNISNNNISTLGSAEASGIQITLNCDFNTLSMNRLETVGAGSYGILLQTFSSSNDINRNNITTSGNGAQVVYLDSSNSNILTDNLLSSSDEDSAGIFLDTVYDSVITGNNISTSAEYSFGIYFVDNSDENQFSYNRLSTSGIEAHGIYFESGSGSNTFLGDILNVSGNLSHGIYFFTANLQNSFRWLNISASGSDSYAVYIDRLNNRFTMQDSFLNSSGASVFVGADSGGNWDFINVSSVGADWTSGSSGTLDVLWYLDINVADSNNDSLEGATLTGWDTQDTLKFVELSNSSGRVITQNLSEYIQTNSGKTFYSNYTVNATFDGRISSYSVNMSENKEINAIIPLAQDEPSYLSSSSSAGGGGGATASFCEDAWSCGPWSECFKGKQTRDCNKTKPACIATYKPETEKECLIFTLTEEQLRKKESGELFDLHAEVLDNAASSSEKLIVAIEMTNLAIQGGVEAVLSYQIKDSLGIVVFQEEENQFIQTHIGFVKELNISSLNEGEYTLYLNLTYDNGKSLANSTSVFYLGKIESGSLFERKGFLISVFVALSVLILVLFGIMILLLKAKFAEFSKDRSFKRKIVSKEEFISDKPIGIEASNPLLEPPARIFSKTASGRKIVSKKEFIS